MKVPKIPSPLRINKSSGNLRIRKLFGEGMGTYMLTLVGAKPMYLNLEELKYIKDWICNELKEDK